MALVSASVAAVVRRDREMTEPEYRERVRVESWEVVVPEMVYAPATIADDAVTAVVGAGSDLGGRTTAPG